MIPSSIAEERNESEKCDNTYAAKQDVKEKNPVLNSDLWKEETTLIVGYLMLTEGELTEAKFSRSKRIKVHYFPGGKTDLQYHLIPYIKKDSNNITIHVGTNDSLYKTENFIYQELVNVKEAINKFHQNCKKIVISSPIFEWIRRQITYLKYTTTF